MTFSKRKQDFLHVKKVCKMNLKVKHHSVRNLKKANWTFKFQIRKGTLLASKPKDIKENSKGMPKINKNLPLTQEQFSLMDPFYLVFTTFVVIGLTTNENSRVITHP